MVNPTNKRPVPRVEWMLRLEPELAAAIDYAAREANVSRNQFIEHAMENYLEPVADGLKAQDETPDDASGMTK